MDEHFSAVAARYRELRTRDYQPVQCIREHLPSRPTLGADIGCGTGRYTESLREQLPVGTRILAADLNRDMLRALPRSGMNPDGIWSVQARAEDLPLRASAFDWVATFNATHHLNFSRFLQEAAGVLKPRGKLFIYTRTPAQNARTVWGRFFPGFTSKEARLWTEQALRGAVEANGRFEIELIKTFRYERTSTPDRLRTQAEQAHYSTFRLYGEEEFAGALHAFLDRLPHPVVRWCDENLMLVCARRRLPVRE